MEEGRGGGAGVQPGVGAMGRCTASHRPTRSPPSSARAPQRLAAGQRRARRRILGRITTTAGMATTTHRRSSRSPGPYTTLGREAEEAGAARGQAAVVVLCPRTLVLVVLVSVGDLEGEAVVGAEGDRTGWIFYLTLPAAAVVVAGLHNQETCRRRAIHVPPPSGWKTLGNAAGAAHLASEGAGVLRWGRDHGASPH